jgi:hypothetical protein
MIRPSRLFSPALSGRTYKEQIGQMQWLIGKIIHNLLSLWVKPIVLTMSLRQYGKPEGDKDG